MLIIINVLMQKEPQSDDPAKGSLWPSVLSVVEDWTFPCVIRTGRHGPTELVLALSGPWVSCDPRTEFPCWAVCVFCRDGIPG